MAQVLVVGGGGREHALAWKLAQSAEVTHVLAAPGNPGIAAEAKCECIDIAATDINMLVARAVAEQIDLVVIGPEAPIAAGLGDAMRAAGLDCCAPGKDGAMLECSKSYCKELLLEAGIPTAQAQVFDNYARACEAINTRSDYPVVIKASGLAAGKGVVIAATQTEALLALGAMMVDECFAAAGSQVLIEDFLQGEEISYMVLVDGEHFLPFASSQDHKRLQDGDTGPNTGGMGAYSPAPRCTSEVEAAIVERVIKPTLAALQKRAIHYRGFLYAGLILDNDNTPWVLEYNCRLGDPETQPLLMRLDSDLYTCLRACAKGELKQHPPLAWKHNPALGIVLAAPGYPNQPKTGQPIDMLPQESRQLKIFHAGTSLQAGKLVASGGRILCATALAADVNKAQQDALAAANSITMPGKFFRRDIGWRAINPV